MVEFDENDLVNQDYENTTTKGDNPDYTAIRDRERVNKKERYEVVYFCNAFVNALFDRERYISPKPVLPYLAAIFQKPG